MIFARPNTAPLASKQLSTEMVRVGESVWCDCDHLGEECPCTGLRRLSLEPGSRSQHPRSSTSDRRIVDIRRSRLLGIAVSVDAAGSEGVMTTQRDDKTMSRKLTKRGGLWGGDSIRGNGTPLQIWFYVRYQT